MQARRHMTDGQKVLLGISIEPDIAAEAERRQEELGRTQGEGPLVTSVTKGRTTDGIVTGGNCSWRFLPVLAVPLVMVSDPSLRAIARHTRQLAIPFLPNSVYSQQPGRRIQSSR